MTLVEKRYTSTYTLLRYRSQSPTSVSAGTLLTLKLDPRSAAVIYQAP
jgi:hypothetical protein